MSRRYLNIIFTAALLSVFIACPIYAADDGASDATAVQASQSIEALSDVQASQSEEALVGEITGGDEATSSDEATGGEAALPGDEKASSDADSQIDGSGEGESNPDELIIEKVTADQIEIVTDESGVEQWGMRSINNTDQNQYCYFFAYFRKSGDDTVYKLYFTGFQYYCRESEYPIAGFKQLIKDMGAAFLNGETFDIYDGNRFYNTYGFAFIPIDAEKASLSNDTKGTVGSTDYPEGDVDLCWAATAANLIQFTSWTTFSDEDKIFSKFKTEFSDYISTTESGIKWFFNGVNLYQTVDENGNVVYAAYSESGKAQQENADTVKYAEAIAAENIIQSYSIEYYSRFAAFDKLMEALNNYNGVGLSIGFYDANGVRTGGHAITCFGYIYDCTNDVVLALYTTDSDDCASEQYVSPSEEANVRADSYNYMTMHPFNYSMFSNGMSTVSLVGYASNRLDKINIMISYPNRGTLTAESDGTMDINNNCDIVISDLYFIDANTKEIFVYDSTEGSDDVYLNICLANRSYAAINSGNGAYVLVNVKLYRGDTLIETFQDWLYFTPSQSNPLVELIFNLTGSTPYTLPAYESKTGEYYRLTGEILKVIDYTDGQTAITEAYTSNNKTMYDPVIQCYVVGYGGDVIDDEGSTDYSDTTDITEIAEVAVLSEGTDAAGVNTGDENNLMLYTLLFIMAMGMAIGLRLRMRM